MPDSTFHPGETIQRGDLTVFFQDSNGVPTNVSNISYAIYYVDPGPPETEVLIGKAERTPANPEKGEYYASLNVPPDAIPGLYRIRWTFQESVSSPINEIVEEWQVQPKNVQVVSYSAIVQECIRRLRIHLRDQCLAGEERVLLDVAGEKMEVSLEELWEVLKDVQG